ncbi:hypothetical protein ACRE_017770 [Hapsidospora chrysogenum ATCC 11550]|uniref:C2H2-type domain-containing protein n=1 Tax=Hapsidospora chrysogenum (strain ATCC 11550 / CBS 779.69 / DSM 880 / IAM 14645 / JCM 23072 / IMI 49137) TaxID=857340 RepID=A0A086TDC2_HAPC1|nr:hypothetical protein ACRE_017770 [Hapsidospora chrysogenum ATCC 11550]
MRSEHKSSPPTRHYCDYPECGKSFRRAEHLTRHKLNPTSDPETWHAGEAQAKIQPKRSSRTSSAVARNSAYANDGQSSRE